MKVALGMLYWNSETDKIEICTAQGQNGIEVRALLAAYSFVDPMAPKDTIFTPLGSDTQAANGETGE